MSSCSKINCIEGNNDVVTKTRNIGSFSEIKSMESFTIIANNDTTYDIEVTGESNLLPYVSTETIGNQLQIKNFPHSCFNENYPIELKVYCPDISFAEISGSGNIDLNNFNGNDIKLKISGSGSIFGSLYYTKIEGEISGSGNIEINGEADNGVYEINGSGSLYAINCKHKNVVVRISGSGSVYVDCSVNLTVDISGSGSVYYTGNPHIISNISGSGTIINNN